MQAQNFQKSVNTHEISANTMQLSCFIKYMEQEYNGMEGMNLGLPEGQA